MTTLNSGTTSDLSGYLLLVISLPQTPLPSSSPVHMRPVDLRLRVSVILQLHSVAIQAVFDGLQQHAPAVGPEPSFGIALCRGAQYVLHFPKGEKYVSVLRGAEEPAAAAALAAERARLRALVHRQLADAAMLAEPDEGAALAARHARAFPPAAAPAVRCPPGLTGCCCHHPFRAMHAVLKTPGDQLGAC